MMNDAVYFDANFCNSCFKKVFESFDDESDATFLDDLFKGKKILERGPIRFTFYFIKKLLSPKIITNTNIKRMLFGILN